MASNRTCKSALRRTCVIASIAALTVGHAIAADAYPNKPIKVISFLPPGSATDFMLRYLAERMGGVLQQPLVVDSKPGANGVIGTRALSMALPDGYTIGMTSNGTLPAAPALYKNTGYDIHKDFAHIGLFSYFPYTLVVSKEVPVSDLKSFLAYARANPGKLTVGHYANSLRFATSEFKRAANLDVLEVPFQSPPQVLTALKQGQVHFSFVTRQVAALAEQGGFGKIIGVTSEKRWPILKEVPAIAEEIPGYSNIAWVALSAPAGTPAPIITKLNAALKLVMESEDTRDKWAGFGGVVAFSSPAEVRRLVESDMPLWVKFAKEENIAPE